MVIVVSSKSNVNAGLASAYMEIMAESLGLGVLYSGFFVVCAKISGKLRKLIQLPKGHKIVSCIIIGHPAVKYQRIVPRKETNSKALRGGNTMQFLVKAYDGPDMLEKRMEVRPRHLEGMKALGEQIIVAVACWTMWVG